MKHRAEAVRSVVLLAKVEVVEAVDEVFLRELVDVLLERKVDEAIGEEDAAVLLHDEHALIAHARDELALDLGMLEVEEVARVIPDETISDDRLAIAADLRLGLEDEVVVGARPAREREPGHAGSHDQMAHPLHQVPPSSPHSCRAQRTALQHVPSQQISSDVHVVEQDAPIVHTPFSHRSAAVQRRPHAPQCRMSFIRSRHPEVPTAS